MLMAIAAAVTATKHLAPLPYIRHGRVEDVEHIKNHFKDIKKKKKRKTMAGMMNKIEGQFGGKKEDQRKGEPQGGHGQQAPKCDTQGGQGQQVHNTQGERPEGFVDKIKDKIPGVGGDKHQGDTQGGCNQQGHNTQGERKEGCCDKTPGLGGTGGVGGGGERKKHGRVKDVEVFFFFCLLPFSSLLRTYKYGTCFLHNSISKTISKI
uniref:Dehydrin n=1 Tax=Salix viminalis TaxID=40686 RepID=A0A6N2NLV2_SALVM